VSRAKSTPPFASNGVVTGGNIPESFISVGVALPLQGLACVFQSRPLFGPLCLSLCLSILIFDFLSST
jgi:hypothetical protein